MQLSQRIFLLWTLIITYALGHPHTKPTDMELQAFCTRYGFQQEIDIISQKIRLYKGGIVIEILPDATLSLINKRIIFLKDPIRIKKGRVILPQQLITAITKAIPQKSPQKPLKALTKIDTIILDAGHGGQDPGNTHHKIQEKDITLAITQKIHKILRTKSPHAKIILTRDTDKFISLNTRSKRAIRTAKSAHKGIFISIHANASLNPKTTGIETYFYSSNPEKDHHTRLSCFHELTHHLTKNPSAHNIISQLYNLQISKESYVLAQSVHKSLYQALASQTLNRGVKSHQPYFVITKNLLPSILVEVGFLSNKAEASFLKQETNQARIAGSIARGISEFLEAFNSKNSFIEDSIKAHKYQA